MVTERTMNSDKHYVELAGFSETPETEPLFFQCPNCAEGVPFSKSTHMRLLQGGVGHPCPHCDRHIAIVVGSCCNSIFAVDEVTWDQLTQWRTVDCPSCSTPLCLAQRTEIALETSFREIPTLRCFSENASEVAFIDAVKTMLPEASQHVLAIYHHTTLERLSLASGYLEALQNQELTSSFAIFNTPNLDEVPPSGALSGSSVLPNLIFQITSTLFSAIESLAQETNVVIGSPWREDNVGYWSFGKIPTTQIELSTCCAAFITQPDFIFLRDLRNLSLHRRVTTLATVAKFTLPSYMSIRPSSVSADCIHHLPDDPSVAPGKETFGNKREVKSTLKQLGEEVNGFVHNLYGSLAKHLSHGK